jgi:hypothetical protein
MVVLNMRVIVEKKEEEKLIEETVLMEDEVSVETCKEPFDSITHHHHQSQRLMLTLTTRLGKEEKGRRNLQTF